MQAHRPLEQDNYGSGNLLCKSRSCNLHVVDFGWWDIIGHDIEASRRFDQVDTRCWHWSWSRQLPCCGAGSFAGPRSQKTPFVLGFWAPVFSVIVPELSVPTTVPSAFGSVHNHNVAIAEGWASQIAGTLPW